MCTECSRLHSLALHRWNQANVRNKPDARWETEFPAHFFQRACFDIIIRRFETDSDGCIFIADGGPIRRDENDLTAVGDDPFYGLGYHSYVEERWNVVS